MLAFLTKGLAETAALWSDVEQGYTWVHRAAHLLSSDDKLEASEVRQTYETCLSEMEQTPTASEPLATMLSTFRKVTMSYWPGLFHCYDHVDLPRTNNGLEQYFGIEARGCQLLFLPAYSPDFSPIEGAFSKLKAILRRVGARTREALQDAIIQALPRITPQDALGWFRHCGYPAPDAGEMSLPV